MPAISQLLLGLTCGLGISLLAWRAHALSRSGALAAALIGALIFGLGGWRRAALLLAFFLTSSALSRLFPGRKRSLSEKFSKGHQRDWGQVLANGGLGALLTLALLIEPQAGWPWIAFAGALAAVNGDTWATELGVLSAAAPRLISTWKKVERGTSGGISLAGSLAALGGAALIGALAALLIPPPVPAAGRSSVLLAVTLAGLCGSFCDSWLGATVQAIYYCPNCRKETERHPRHSCGAATQLHRGWRWLNNDLVNFAASVCGALLAFAFWLVF